MAKLLYVTNVSLDGYIEDAQGDFGFAEPSDEYFAFITDLIRPIGTWLYGRRLYEAMQVWETDSSLAEGSALRADFASAWQAGDKIVYSSTLTETSTARTRVERTFDADAVAAIQAEATSDLTVGGAILAAHAFDAGLVDECHLFIGPVVVGRGKPAFQGQRHVPLELVDERRFDNGVLYTRHRVQR